MLAKYLVLALLPTIAYSRIYINVKPHANGAGAFVGVRGEDEDVVTDSQREIFKITDETLKKASETFNGKTCSNVYVKPPTLWGDVYAEHGWSVVKAKLRPFHTSVVGVSMKPVTLGVQEYFNSKDVDVTYTMSVIKEVDETISHTWTQGKQLGAGREIDYHINFGEKSLGGSASLTYSAPWGEGPTKSRKVTVGNKSSTSASIPPGVKMLAKLTAVEHRVEVEVRYEAFLEGKVFCNYDEKYKGHHFYTFNLRELQNTARTPRNMYAIETITLNLYSDIKLEITNGPK